MIKKFALVAALAFVPATGFAQTVTPNPVGSGVTGVPTAAPSQPGGMAPTAPAVKPNPAGGGALGVNANAPASPGGTVAPTGVDSTIQRNPAGGTIVAPRP
jgi:hypothetical protein